MLPHIDYKNHSHDSHWQGPNVITESGNVLGSIFFFLDKTATECLSCRKHLILLIKQTINKEKYFHAEQAAHVETVKWTHTQTSHSVPKLFFG